MTDLVTIIADALREEAARFRDPVRYYVRQEAEHRGLAEPADPDFRTEDDDARIEAESWKILARAVATAIENPTPVMELAGAAVRVTVSCEGMCSSGTVYPEEGRDKGVASIWRAMVAADGGVVRYDPRVVYFHDGPAQELNFNPETDVTKW